MLGEREELKKKQDSLERQYKELERQLAVAKHSVINDQKASRQREDTLREVIINYVHYILVESVTKKYL